MKRLRRLMILLILLALVGLGAAFLVQYVDTTTKEFRYTRIEDLPTKRVAVVFGASIRPSGELSPILRDRVDMGITLYKEKKVEKLLMSGDNRTNDYNEAAAMQAYAVKNGVPEADITLDFAGLSTYESCYRAKEIFGLTEAILVTQRYHLPRALYACRHLGVAAVGIEVADWEKYPDIKEVNLRREELATYKMLWDIHITRPKPTHLGNFEGIK